jgi:hypothetical protein
MDAHLTLVSQLITLIPAELEAINPLMIPDNGLLLMPHAKVCCPIQCLLNNEL